MIVSVRGTHGLAAVVFFNDTATTEIYTLSLHDALPIFPCRGPWRPCRRPIRGGTCPRDKPRAVGILVRGGRLEEHTSELQSRQYLVCRLLLEKTTLRLLQPYNRRL